MGTDWRPRARACRRRAQRGLRLEKLESRLAMAADLTGLLEAAGGTDCQCAACQGLLVAAEAAMAAAPAESSAVSETSLTSLPLLSSNPTAAAKLFLDFDGHFEANWSSRTNLTTPAFDQDGAPNTFSATELLAIREIWARVAEDYAPFNLDVTTIDPGTPADFVVAVIAIGGSYTDWYGAAAGGVALNGGFANGSSNVGYVFAQSLGGQTKFVAESASHEAGHLFGLSHQALWTGTTLTSPYNSGTADWAPIMGSSYYAPRTTWHNGPTSAGPAANQDEMAIIGSATNRFGYRADDFGSTRLTATALPTAGQSVAVAGILERADDQDVWSVISTGGPIDLELTGAAVGANLNAVLELVTSDGTVVVSSAPADSLGARLSTMLAAGSYFLTARSEGDYGNVGQYSLTGTLGPGDHTPPTADIVDVSPDPRNSHAGVLRIAFSEPVIGFDSGDLSLLRNGTAIGLPAGSLSGSGTAYTLDLASATAAAGTYDLRVVAQGSGIRDGAGNSLLVDAVDSWMVDTTAPEADIVDVLPNPRNGPVLQVAIQFTEPVTGLDLADLALMRNFSGVSLAGAALSGSGATYSLELSGVSQLAGSYELRLSRGGIADLAGNALASEAIARWSMEQSGPSVGIFDIHPDPRNSSVGVVGFQFSEVVTGFDVSDLELVRGGTVVSLAGLAVTGSGSSYAIDLSSVTAAAGSYQLTLVAGGAEIRDAAGNPLLSGASDSWVMDGAAPLVAWSGIGPPFGNVPTAVVSLNFSEVVTGVDLADFELRRNGALVSLLPAPFAGSGSQYTVDLTAFNASSGSYELRLVAAGSSIRDSAGNPLTAGLAASWALDVTPPTANISAVTPNPRATPLPQVAVNFSEPVTQVDVADVTLFRDGTRLALAAGSVSGTGQSYTVDLSGQTTLAGEYVLQVVAAGSGIQDSAGNLLSGNAQVTWRQDFHGPRAQWGALPGGVRNQAVETLRLDFDEAVTGVDSADFSLTRDSLPVPLAAAFLRGSGTGYFLDLASVTALAGSYVLRLRAANSAIVDAAGNAVQEEATISWEVDTTAPQAQTQFDLVTTPYLRDAVTRVTVTFSEAVRELAADSVELLRDNVRVPWGSGNSSGGSVLTLELGAQALSKGSYRLRIPAEAVRDLAGNPLAADLVRTWQTSEVNPWHNRENPLDVDGAQGVTARDVLTLINELNARRYSDAQTARLSSPAEVPAGLFFDVNNDHFVTAGDCLSLINFLNAYGPKPESAEGEAAEASLRSAEAAELPQDLLELLAVDNQVARSRRPGNRERR